MSQFTQTGLSWLDHAGSFIGLREIKGKKHNTKILDWWEDLKTSFRDDETPWCGGFVGGTLAETGFPVFTKGAGARNWLKYGKHLDEPCVGAIVVFWRGRKSGWSGHVGYIVGKDRYGNLMVLGGNQGNMVSIKPFKNGDDPDTRVLGYRWPSIAPAPHRYNLPIIESDGRISKNEA